MTTAPGKVPRPVKNEVVSAVIACFAIVPPPARLVAGHRSVRGVGVRHGLGPGIGHTKLQPLGETPRELGLQRMVVGGSGVLPLINAGITWRRPEEVVAQSHALRGRAYTRD